MIRATLERTASWGSMWYLAAKANILASQHFANLLSRPTFQSYTLHPRDVAMATTFWLSMGCKFSCMLASDNLGVSFQGEAMAYATKTWPKIDVLTVAVDKDMTAHCKLRYRPCAAAMRPSVKLLWPFMLFLLYTVSQKTSHLCFAITLTHTNGFWYSLAEMLPIK